MTTYLKRLEEKQGAHRVPLVKTHRVICVMTSKDSFENMALGQSQVMARNDLDVLSPL